MSSTNLVKIQCPVCDKDTPYRVKFEANFDREYDDFI